MSKFKVLFMKACTIVVVAYFFYFLFFIKIEREIISLCERFSKSFWLIVKGNSVSTILFFVIVCLIAIGMIDWILDDTKKRKKKIEKEEEKIEEVKE